MLQEHNTGEYQTCLCIIKFSFRLTKVNKSSAGIALIELTLHGYLKIKSTGQSESVVNKYN